MHPLNRTIARTLYIGSVPLIGELTNDLVSQKAIGDLASCKVYEQLELINLRSLETASHNSCAQSVTMSIESRHLLPVASDVIESSLDPEQGDLAHHFARSHSPHFDL